MLGRHGCHLHYLPGSSHSISIWNACFRTAFDRLDCCGSDGLSSFNQLMDITGRRVNSYYNVKCILGYCRRLKRIVPYSADKPFPYSVKHHHSSLVTFSVCEKLKPNWQRSIPSDTANVHCSWYHHVLKSLYTHTKVWRGEPSPVKMLNHTVSPENKMTNKGAANVVMFLLLYHRIVKPVNSDGANGDVKGMRLADDYDQRMLCL